MSLRKTYHKRNGAVVSSGNSREQFKSRLGFILISAGCAIGLGNVWRFPYIVGEYGGAAFVIMYLVFLFILGIPILTMELAVGRASQKSTALAFDKLEPKGTKWHGLKWISILGLYLLMMFYTTVAGWMIAYIPKMATFDLAGSTTETMAATFNSMLSSPGEMIGWMLVATVLAMFVCSLGLQNGIERITKVLMVGLLIIVVGLAVRSVTLEGAGEGLAFYLLPDFSNMFSSPERFSEAAFAALGQSFFTLSIGIGSMEIFGSYIDKTHTLTGEAVRIAGLDTFVAIMMGIIIFPACFAFGVSPDSGPSLVFVTLPAVFGQMPAGSLFAVLFFVLMSFAAVSTLIAVFEGILAFWMDLTGMSRKRAVIINIILIPLLSLPCALGFNVWSGFTIPGIGDIQSIEDFLVSNNFLVLGSLGFVLFCTLKRGWGWDGFIAEADSGNGLKFPKWLRGWVRFGIPALIIVILVSGWLPLVQSWIS